MSWDVYIYSFDGSTPPPRDADGRYPGRRLGTRKELMKQLSRDYRVHWDARPFGEAHFGMFTSPDFSVEFQLTGLPEVESLRIGVSEPAFGMHFLKELCERYGWFALDAQEGKFFDFSALKFLPIEEGLEGVPDEDDLSEDIHRPQVEELRYM
jgi:hypothetical protein